MTAFQLALAQTLVFEGSVFTDDPRDLGGATLRGVTQRTYDAWRATTGQSKRSVAFMGEDEMQAIYLANYWMPCNCDLLPAPLAGFVFDMAVNSGVWNAKLALQRVVRVRADGVIGPVTLAAITKTPDVARRYLKQRAALLQEILAEHPGQVAFLEGWIVRLIDLAATLGDTP